MSEAGQHRYSNVIGERRGGDTTGRHDGADAGRDAFPDELHERRMEEDQEESTYRDGGVRVNVHPRANRDRHGFQLKELVRPNHTIGPTTYFLV